VAKKSRAITRPVDFRTRAKHGNRLEPTETRSQTPLTVLASLLLSLSKVLSSSNSLLIEMSATSTPADSPVSAPIQPLHNPSQAAHIVVPQAPLGNVANGASSAIPGMGMKALLAKKMAKSKCVTHTSETLVAD